ncbi:MAG: ArsR/SmtB family transcription factor [Vulcanimicrobiaceae bacterium]
MSMQRACREATVHTADLSTEAALLRALADPHRLNILATLAGTGDAVCVCDFTAALPLNQPTVSHHLKILREAHLVRAERCGTWMHYRLEDDAYARLRAALDAVFAARVTA